MSRLAPLALVPDPGTDGTTTPRVLLRDRVILLPPQELHVPLGSSLRTVPVRPAPVGPQELGSHIPEALPRTSTICWAPAEHPATRSFPQPPTACASQRSSPPLLWQAGPQPLLVVPRGAGSPSQPNQHTAATRALGRAEHGPQRCSCPARYNHQAKAHAKPQMSGKGLLRAGCRSQGTRAGNSVLGRGSCSQETS